MSGMGDGISIYPATLLDGTDGEFSDHRWWVLYTRARQEKALARELFRQKVPFYLPLIRKTSYCRGRPVRSRIPLFSGYMFLFASQEDRIRSLTTNRVSRVLEVGDRDSLLHDLRQVRQMIASDAPMTVEDRLLPGNRVRVRHGPLAGVEGTVLTRRGRTRLLVSVNFLQKGASVEIEDYLLEPIG